VVAGDSPFRVVPDMRDKFMSVSNKSNRTDKRTQMLVLDRFVEKTTPVARHTVLDAVQIDQRNQAPGWVWTNTRKCTLLRCHGGRGC
jgi:hypothetical protein